MLDRFRVKSAAAIPGRTRSIQLGHRPRPGAGLLACDVYTRPSTLSDQK